VIETGRAPQRYAPWQVGLAAFTVLAVVVATIGLGQGRPWGFAVLAVVPIAILVRERPWLFALALILGGAILRLLFVGLQDADQVRVAQAALDTVLAGGNPYGHGYAVSIPPGAPFPYGPLALLASVPGIWMEFAAAIATMALMARYRAWLALGIYAAAPLATSMTLSGTNDILPGLLITLGLLALRERSWVGGLWLALAAGIKPYAAAWFPAVVALGGTNAVLVLLGVSAAAWSPLLIWGIRPFLDSVATATQVHPVPENALNAPVLRILAVPVAVVEFFSRSWLAAVMLGTAVFVLVLFLDRWASVSYWLAIVPILLLAGEETVVRMVRHPERRTKVAGG
jgi:hypothetical protein